MRSGEGEAQPVAREGVVGAELYAGLGGVAYHKVQLLAARQRPERLRVAVGVERRAYRAHHAAGDKRLAIGACAAQLHSVQAVLRAEGVQIAVRAGLYHGYVARKVAAFVGDVYHPVRKGAQEVALDELRYAYRALVGAVYLI